MRDTGRYLASLIWAPSPLDIGMDSEAAGVGGGIGSRAPGGGAAGAGIGAEVGSGAAGGVSGAAGTGGGAGVGMGTGPSADSTALTGEHEDHWQAGIWPGRSG